MRWYSRSGMLKSKNITIWGILFGALIALSFLVRIINLNYNTPFNDEAIYVVVGKLGIFQWDWWSYNAKSWMAGLPFAYPPLTALSYQLGGIVGSRLLNVVFGVLLLEEIYRLTNFLAFFDSERKSKFAALMAIVFASFSSVGIYVSKLATYDIPSFFFMFFAINSFLKATKTQNGKYYFIASISLIFAFAMKIVVLIFLPFFVVISFLLIYKNREHLKFWIKYFLIPVIMFSLFYFLYNIDGFFVFAKTQIIREYVPFGILFTTTWIDIWPFLVIFAVSLFSIIFNRNFNKKVITLILLGLVIPLFHFLTHRLATYDKHLYLSVLFLSPIVAYGITYIIFVSPKYLKFTRVFLILGIIILYFFSYNTRLRQLELAWDNTDTIESYLATHVKPGQKVLTQTGGETVLALYDITHPKNITTFDWIDYQGTTDDKGYIQAIKDGYFDFIEIDSNFEGRKDLITQMNKEMDSKYRLSYQENTFSVYEKI